MRPFTRQTADRFHSEVLAFTGEKGRESIRGIFAEIERAAVMQFADAILHGSHDHRDWLLEAAEAFVENRPMPAARS